MKATSPAQNSLLSFLAFGCFLAAIIIYAIWSFSLTDPNLVLLSWSPYWQFQQWMWQTFFTHAELLTQSYLTVITLLVFSWIGWAWTLRKNPPSFAVLACLLCLLGLPLFFSNNALSHDIFNYIFNAKMVVVYHANPHVQVALEFGQDLWTRFMHNTHTPAPYGYGWTVVSLLPYLLGMGRFLPTWLLFRLTSAIFVIGLWAAYRWSEKFFPSPTRRNEFRWWAMLTLANPLLLIEVISNAHNDLWMMVPAVWAVILVKFARQKTWRLAIFTGTLLAFSISIKFASLLLVPIWGALLISELLPTVLLWKKPLLNILEFVTKYWAEFAVIAMSLPLFTDRSQQFHPWYLVWLLVWIPWEKTKWLRWLVIAFSVSSLLRYVPWLLAGGFNDAVISQEKLITWGGGILFFGLTIIATLIFSTQRKGDQK